MALNPENLPLLVREVSAEPVIGRVLEALAEGIWDRTRYIRRLLSGKRISSTLQTV